MNSKNILQIINDTGKYSTIDGQGKDKLEKIILLKNSIGGNNVTSLKEMVGKEIKIIHVMFEKLKEPDSDDEYISMTLADENGELYRTSGEYARQVVIQTIDIFGSPSIENPFIYVVEEIQSKKNNSWKYIGLMLKNE